MNGRLNVQRCGFVFLHCPLFRIFTAIWQARIALLEGERRSFENIKLDFMRRIKMLEYALRMERSVRSFSLYDFPRHLLLKDPSNLPNQPHTPLLPQSSSLSRQMQLLCLKKTTHIAKRKIVAAALQGVKVCFFCNHLTTSSCISSYGHLTLLDSPLPDGRLPNGGSINGPSGRQNYWGSTNWSNPPAGGTIANLGKPPLGRDPKSRARSRDYLKQYVVLASHTF
jgi:striatin 1/3/4